MNAWYSCQRITTTTAAASSDFQLSFDFFGPPGLPALLVSLVADLVSAGRSATSRYLGLLSMTLPFCSLLLNLIDRERHVSAGNLPYSRRVIVKRVQDPVLLTVAIVECHCPLHLVREDDVIDVLPAGVEQVVPYLRVRWRIPVRLGVRIVRAHVVQGHPDVLVGDDLVIGRDVLAYPGDLLVLDVGQRQVVDVGQVVRLAAEAVLDEVARGREEQQRPPERGQSWQGNPGCRCGNPAKRPVRDQAGVQRIERDQRQDVEIQDDAAPGQVERDLKGEGAGDQQGRILPALLPSQV